MAGRRAGSIVIRSLVPIQTTDERDYARLSVDIEVRKRQMAQLQAERDKLELALSRFAVDLKNRVGGVRTELNRVRLQTAEFRRRIERLGDLRRVKRFGLVEQKPAVAIGRGDQSLARRSG